MMLGHMVVFSLVATIIATDGIELDPIKSDDLQTIVDSVKNDVELHMQLMTDRLKLANVDQTSEESTVSSKSVTEDTKVIHDITSEDDDNEVKHEDTSNDDHSEEVPGYLSDAKIYYGAVKGLPGVDFPDYTDIPKTSFTCWDKTKFPGYYADMETGCQVFHVCRPDRQESFLCPMGTTFNQEFLTCDYWYNSKCSLASFFYYKNLELEPDFYKSVKVPSPKKDYPSLDEDSAASVMSYISQLMPIKAKVLVFPKAERWPSKIASGDYHYGRTHEKMQTKYPWKPHASKHHRVPRSLEYASSFTDTLVELKDKIFYYRFWEALNNGKIKIQNNKYIAHLTPYAEHVLKFLKKWIFKNKCPEKVIVEPGTELYEYDVYMKNEDMLILCQKLVELSAELLFKFEYHVKGPEFKRILHEIAEGELMTPKVTSLNPKFIVKPDFGKVEIADSFPRTSFKNVKVKHSEGALNPKLSREDPMNIHPETKKSLLKSYVKLYKTKHG